MMKPTKLMPLCVISFLMIYSSCDFIGDRNYEISELNGTYVIRNYLDDGGTYGPSSNDTLYLCDGKYKNKYLGNGNSEVDRLRGHAFVLFRYKNSLGQESSTGYNIDKPPFGKQRLTINSDLNYYYERISKECPDVFEK